MTDEYLLLQKCMKGDLSAQYQIYDTYKSMWFTIALRYLKSRDDASDALQNALIKIYGKLDLFKPETGQFKSWSSKIVVNECIMYQRKYWKKAAFQEITDDMNWTTDEETPISRMTTQEMVSQVQNLPDGYRLVFNLYSIEGYSHKEIGKMLDISEGTSKSQLFKARKILKGKIESMFNNV